jgi:HYR domain
MICPAAMSVNTTPNLCNGVATYTNPTFTDNCAPATGTATRVSGLASGSSFPVGNSNVVFQATDAAGNTRRCTMVITVVDNQPPVVTCPPNAVVIGSGAPCKGFAFFPNATATDNCSGTLSTFLVSGLSSGSAFPAGVTTNTFRAVASNGQSGECTFTVNVDCSGFMAGNSGLEDRDAALEIPQSSSNLNLVIAPNPALSAVTVSIDGVGVGGGTLLVFDPLGRLVQQQMIAKDQPISTLQVAEFALGLYRICLKTDDGMVTKTLVVVK